MKHPIRATKADRERFDALQRIGCICCRERMVYSQPDVHHLLSGGRRIGHQHPIPLCAWHHRSVPQNGLNTGQMQALLGPSLALTPRRFRQAFGDDGLLLKLTNRLIARAAWKRPVGEE